MEAPFETLSGVESVARDAQLCDHGRQYRTAIFYHDATQERLAKASREALETSKRFERPIVTESVPAGAFWPAEDYHQRYCASRGEGGGRKVRLRPLCQRSQACPDYGHRRARAANASGPDHGPEVRRLSSEMDPPNVDVSDQR